MFYQMFLHQMPVMHVATFTIDGKPQVLLSAMQACGALYVKTAAASQFIDHTLKNAREQLLQEFVSTISHRWYVMFSLLHRRRNLRPPPSRCISSWPLSCSRQSGSSTSDPTRGCSRTSITLC